MKDFFIIFKQKIKVNLLYNYLIVINIIIINYCFIIFKNTNSFNYYLIYIKN